MIRKEQLLEAIGQIDENMLMQSERTPARGRTVIRRAVLIAAMMGLLAVTVAATAGLFSRPIGETEILGGEIVAPFEMDAQGNIIPGGVEGIKITMDVDVDQNAPKYLEEIYHIELSDDWQYIGGGRGGDLYTHWAWSARWMLEGKPGAVRLHQSIVNRSGEKTQVVDTLEKLTANGKLSAEKTTMAGLSVLKLTIPEQPGYEGTKYCPDGETRLYWSDGRYLLQLDYPSWMSDAQAEELLKTLSTQKYFVAYPEDYGKVNTQRLLQLNPAFSIEKGNTGTNMGNSVMGWGRFAYSDGAVYYGNDGEIIRYDLQTQKVKKYPLPYKLSSTLELFATENYICYEDMRDALMAVPKKGGDPIVIYQGLGVTHLFADGSVLYTNNGSNYLSRIDLRTGEEEILVEDANSYYVDDTYIYVVQSSANGKYFLRSQKDNVAFEKVPLSIYPIKVFANGENLYFCSGGVGGTRQVVHYSNGVETPLPVYAYDYQVLNGKLIYVDQKDTWTVKSYDLKTGEIKTLQERASDFSILEERYICFTCVDAENHPYPRILDLQTGEYHQPTK